MTETAVFSLHMSVPSYDNFLGGISKVIPHSRQRYAAIFFKGSSCSASQRRVIDFTCASKFFLPL